MNTQYCMDIANKLKRNENYHETIHAQMRWLKDYIIPIIKVTETLSAFTITRDVVCVYLKDNANKYTTQFDWLEYSFIVTVGRSDICFTIQDDLGGSHIECMEILHD